MRNLMTVNLTMRSTIIMVMNVMTTFPEKAIPGSHHDKLGRKIVERYRQHRPREQARQKRFAPLMHNPYFRGRRDKISSRMALRQRQR